MVKLIIHSKGKRGNPACLLLFCKGDIMHSTGDIIIMMFGACAIYYGLRFVDSLVQKWLGKGKQKRGC